MTQMMFLLLLAKFQNQAIIPLYDSVLNRTYTIKVSSNIESGFGILGDLRLEMMPSVF